MNLVTLNIRDAEMSKEYHEARMQNYWTSIVVADILRELVFSVIIMAGFFSERDLSPSYAARIIYYFLVVLLYSVSKTRPQIKEWVAPILTLYYNLFFIVAAKYMAIYG